MRLAFLGTPEFAVPPLQKLVEAGHCVEAVLTQPDRPKGRGQELAPPPVKECAIRLGLPVHQPERIRRPEAQDLLRAMSLDVMVVVGYGQIIPQSVIDMVPHGIINVHGSLLPAYRGAAPVQWAVANGEKRTGVTTMRIDAGLDTGGMLLKWDTEIGAEETAVELGRRLSVAGADLLIETLEGIESGVIQPVPQDPAAATYAPILKKEDASIDWNWPAAKIHARQRGFQPWPGAATTFRGQTLQIHRCRVKSSHTLALPGTLITEKKRLLVAAGGGSMLEIEELQLQGRKRVYPEAFLNGHRLLENERLGENR
ncbi:MAG: methionyl-tRNA formyltransferase [Acidobacteria bacterium]|nr:methionyl-tRNA formyltransferase [Acidobacteriota bacterium]